MTKKKKDDSKKSDTASLDGVVKLTNDLAKKLLNLLGTKAKASVVLDSDDQSVLVNIEASEEAGLLIGNKGKTISAIQAILGMMIRTKTGEWHRVVVNIGDWREKEKDRLEQLALQAAERAKSTGEEQFLYNLTPVQRRIIHLFLSNDESIATRSEGEGEGRFLIVSPK